jgi:hypothetical protein
MALTVGACNTFVSIVEQNQWTCWDKVFQFAIGRIRPVCGPVGQAGVLACEFRQNAPPPRDKMIT